MAECSSCRKRMGLFEKKYAGQSGASLCRRCALHEQRVKYAERLTYMLKQVEAFPQHVEPLRDCEMEMHFAELLLSSDAPLSASRSRELARVKNRFQGQSSSQLQLRRQTILEGCLSLVERLKEG